MLWALILGFLLALAAEAKDVLTYQYDNTRAGLNNQEVVLTPANVNAAQFGKLFSYPVDGFIYGQPLYLANVNVAGKGVHNVVYVVTEHDSVYAFDADSNAGPNASPLWQVNFLNPSAGVTSVPALDVGCEQIIPEIGITSTPVIDPATGTIYVVVMTREATGSAVSYVHRLHALDAGSGAERPGSPVVIQATYPGTGEGGSTVVFNARNYKQRPGLLLLNGVVYTAWSSHCDIGVFHGWLIGYDARTLQQAAVYNDTPNGNEGSFWAAGAAPAADAAGNIYLVAGNGTFDHATGGPDLGNSYIKLSTAAGLSVADYFTPFNVAALNTGDLDVGSAGVALLPDEAGGGGHAHLMVGAGKEGRIYLLDRDNLGQQSAGDSQIVQSLPGAIGGLFGNPAYFNHTVYFCGSGDTLKAYPIANGRLAAAPASQSPGVFGYPGCAPTVSANGSSNGIVWALGAPGVLHAYDASNVGAELYNSSQNMARDFPGGYVKFTVPAVANGKVYAGGPFGLNVYGLLPVGPRLFWQSEATGQALVDYYTGAPAVLSGWAWMYQASALGWTVVGAADFDGNGVPDLVWQNDSTRQVTVTYYGGVQGNVLLGWNWLYASPMTGWRIAAIADFNGDGTPDIVWQNDSTGVVTVNYFGGPQGTTLQGWDWLNSSGEPGWRVVAAADFDGNGTPDLVWQNTATRMATVNYYQGAALIGWAWLYSSPLPGWSIAGAADFDRDGKPDVVWQNDVTRQVTVNYFAGPQGNQLQSAAWLYSSPLPGWHTVVSH